MAMKRTTLAAILAAAAVVPVALYAFAKGDKPALSPNEIATAAPTGDWRDIPDADLLLMETAGGGRVVIQLAPDFAPVHIANIRKLAEQRWWDGTAIVRVQDNYVVQWGDPTEKKVLPSDVVTRPPDEYVRDQDGLDPQWIPWPDPYAKQTGFAAGWPVGGDNAGKLWLAHCYAMVGVGRNMAPDTGTGAELYAVIGQAPRHLDRNIALVGRVLEGMEFLASRPRGTADLGFYAEPGQRIAITRLVPMAAADPAKRVRYQYLAGDSFAAYREARANRRDPFFNVPAGGADICNIPVPIRRKP
jgi:peptidylprolyl isomerase